MPPISWPQSSSAVDLAAALAQQYFLFAGKHELTSLIVHCSCEGHDAGRALRRQRRNFDDRVERVSRVDRLQELRRLLGERDQRVADGKRKIAGPRGGETQDLKAMREQPRVAALAAIFAVVMDRVIVAPKGSGRRRNAPRSLSGSGCRSARRPPDPRNSGFPDRRVGYSSPNSSLALARHPL